MTGPGRDGSSHLGFDVINHLVELLCREEIGKKEDALAVRERFRSVTGRPVGDLSLSSVGQTEAARHMGQFRPSARPVPLSLGLLRLAGVQVLQAPLEHLQCPSLTARDTLAQPDERRRE